MPEFGGYPTMSLRSKLTPGWGTGAPTFFHDQPACCQSVLCWDWIGRTHGIAAVKILHSCKSCPIPHGLVSKLDRHGNLRWRSSLFDRVGTFLFANAAC